MDQPTMTPRYLCKNHFQKFSQDLDSANRTWNSSITQGMRALDESNYKKAQYCFGAAYEIAHIILDRTITDRGDSNVAANTLLSAQYLATSLIYLNETQLAAQTLLHVHEKFIFLCRNSAAPETMRTTLRNNMIPYIEKLYEQVLNKNRDQQIAVSHDYSNPASWPSGSTLYH